MQGPGLSCCGLSAIASTIGVVAGVEEIREGPLLDEPTMRVLETAYLLRPEDVARLASELGEPVPDLQARLSALEAGGFLRRVGGRLEYESPYAAFVAIGASRARAILAENQRTVAMMDALPRLIRAWDLGTADPGGLHPLAVSLVHARSGSWQEWFRHVEAERAVDPSIVCTDEGVLAVALRSGHLEHLAREVAPDGGRVRVLCPVDPGFGADLATDLDRARCAGTRFRRSPDATGWMHVDPPSIVALPLSWGAATPESAIVIRTPPVVTALAALFDRLWRASHPWGADDEPWGAVLGLLSRGLTDDAIARALGTTSRTVRRRIAEAAVELGATSRFTLGVAWAARQPDADR